MSETIYNQTHVAVNRLLGRDYNNPLGEAAFPLLKRLLPARESLVVLDAGCGRGQTAIWWAGRAGANVDAFDPSPAMLGEARQRAEATETAGRIRFHQAEISRFGGAARYDLILAHDVLCYSGAWKTDAASLAAQLKAGGLFSLTDYYREDDTPEVRGVLSAWGIPPPQSFREHAQTLHELGLRPLFHFDTTRQYREHWAGLREVLDAKWEEAVGVIGWNEVTSFARQIDAILHAVASGKFGHCWTILEARS